MVARSAEAADVTPIIIGVEDAHPAITDNVVTTKSETHWPKFSSSCISNGSSPHAFDEALTSLASIHRQEVAHLRDKVVQLQAVFQQPPSPQKYRERAIVEEPIFASNGPTYRELVVSKTTNSNDNVYHELDLVELMDTPDYSDMALSIAQDLASTNFDMLAGHEPLVDIQNGTHLSSEYCKDDDENLVSTDNVNSHASNSRATRHTERAPRLDSICSRDSTFLQGVPDDSSELFGQKACSNRGSAADSMPTKLDSMSTKMSAVSAKASEVTAVRSTHSSSATSSFPVRVMASLERKIQEVNSPLYAYAANASSSYRVNREANKLDRFVENPKFDIACGLVIAVNSVLIGYNVNMYATTDDHEETKLIGHCFNLFFLVELLLRLFNQRIRYFTSEQRSWNLFDMLLVFLSIVDFFLEEVLQLGQNQNFSSVKLLKMLRIMRIFRVFRFFHKLAVLVLMILDSMMSLVWALLMLIIIIYVFAIVFTQSASNFMENELGKEIEDQDFFTGEVHRWFGSVPRAIYTLFQAMLGGVSWGVVTDALLATGWELPLIFFFYVSFTMLVVLNIITGVFVENAMETARSQREFLIQKDQEAREIYIKEMRELFYAMDEDGNGTVTLDEVLNCLMDPNIRFYFQAVGMETRDVERLFGLLDADESGEVTIEEFLEGCLRLKGMARSIDVHHIIHNNKKMEKMIDDNFKIMRRSLGVKDEMMVTTTTSRRRGNEDKGLRFPGKS